MQKMMGARPRFKRDDCSGMSSRMRGVPASRPTLSAKENENQKK